ncbi:uncharacterized protein LOC119550468 [Drosophila subpulchrella]|uniref:uncharacterized protein LOC119550468 n=1 Tax=Drosophila subpulchrella TaxID=1486046 RepID=UPI0018A14541|nr:uncharacterized protein LOC119550468 [Drosophila subpulchrella]
MLTKARDGDSKGRRRWPAMFWMWLPVWLLLLPGQVLLGDAASVTWGHVNKYASVLHTEDVYLASDSPSQDIIYGSQNASDNYRITGIHVEDLSGGAEALLTAGGIGQEFVVLHSQRIQESKEEKPEPAHLEVSIYGVDL